MTQAAGLAKRLESMFGLGEFAMVRRRLYLRLERIASASEPAYVIISDVAITAKSKTSPGRWFASAVCRRLEESGLAGHLHDAAADKERVAREMIGRYADQTQQKEDPNAW